MIDRRLFAWALLAGIPSAVHGQTVSPQPEGSLGVNCPSGRTATMLLNGAQRRIDVREPDGRTWMLGLGPRRPEEDPAKLADWLCRL